MSKVAVNTDHKKVEYIDRLIKDTMHNHSKRGASNSIQKKEARPKSNVKKSNSKPNKIKQGKQINNLF